LSFVGTQLWPSLTGERDVVDGHHVLVRLESP